VSVPSPGEPFPRIFLEDANGRPAQLPEGEAVYAFFKTTCDTSEFAWPFLERVRRLADRGPLSVVAVSQDGPEETARFNERTGTRIPTLYDPPPWPASATLGMKSVPMFFVVGRDGRILDSIVGFLKVKMEDLGQRASALSGRPYTGLFAPEENVPVIRPG
jgi:peroxiredoxin